MSQILSYLILITISYIISSFLYSLVVKIPKYIYEEIKFKSLFKFQKNDFIQFKNKQDILFKVLFISLIMFNFYFFKDERLKFIFSSIFISFTMPMFFIDLKHYLLPDVLNFPLIFLGVLINYNGLFSNGISNSILGAVLSYLILYLIYYIFLKIKKIEGMGLGDLKLISAIGAWFGYHEIANIVTIASILGLIFSLYLKYFKKVENGKIPFGPFLILTALPLFYIK